MKNNRVTRHKTQVTSKLKRGVCLFVIATLCFLFIPQLAQAATYYLDAVNGSDSNVGTSIAPWKTMSKVESSSMTGDTIVIQEYSAAMSEHGINWPDRKYRASKVTQHITHSDARWVDDPQNITWTFDSEKEIGRFVNGDFWVLGPVTITNISPGPFVEIPEVERNSKIYRCKSTHISSSSDEPGIGTNWQTYWEYIKDGQGAQNGLWASSRKYYFMVQLNGTMINLDDGVPYPGHANQGFDGRLTYFDTSLYKTTPIVINNNASIISSIAWRLGDNYPSYNTTVQCPRPATKAILVLTVLNAVPSGQAFRPSVFGDSKELYYIGDMDLSILPSLAPVNNTPLYSVVKDRMRKPWILMLGAYPLGYLGGTYNTITTASDNAPYIGEEPDMVSALLLLNEQSLVNNYGYPSGWKRIYACRLAQLGIDMYGAINNGFGSGWNGGEVGHGYKWPVLFAGMILNDQGMMAIGDSHGADPRGVDYWNQNGEHNKYFQEDGEFFYIKQSDVDTWSTSNKIVTRQNCHYEYDAVNARHMIIDDSGGDWRVSGTGVNIPATYTGINHLRDYWLIWNYDSANEEFRRVALVNPDSTVDNPKNEWNKLIILGGVTSGNNVKVRVQFCPPQRLGMPEYAERYILYPDAIGKSDYRHNVSRSMLGEYLAARALKTGDGLKSGKDLWKWDATFDFMDYHVAEPKMYTWQSRYSTFTQSMWDAYRADYGPIWPNRATILYGDVDGNGEISAYDAALTAQAAVGLITLTATQTQAADVSGEGEVSAYDAALIAQKAVGLIDKFPVES